MQREITLILVAVAGGLIGGMGMGGGTLLIPLLTVLVGVDQHSAQALNLIAFLPMSVVALIIHARNGLVDFKSVPISAIPALITSPLASFLALSLSGKFLGRAYGIFLIALGLYQAWCVTATAIQNKLGKNGNWIKCVLFKNKF